MSKKDLIIENMIDEDKIKLIARRIMKWHYVEFNDTWCNSHGSFQERGDWNPIGDAIHRDRLVIKLRKKYNIEIYLPMEKLSEFPIECRLKNRFDSLKGEGKTFGEALVNVALLIVKKEKMK